MTEILEIKDPLQRLTDLTALLSGLGPTAAPALLEAFETAPINGGDPEFVVLGMWWARFDPRAAFDWTKTDLRAQYAPVIAGIVRSWAQGDPEAALTAALAIPFPGQREFACEAAIAGWDESGKPGLIEAVEQLGDVDQQRVSEGVARRRVAALGAASAFAWLETLEDPNFREMMAVRVASAAAGSVDGGPLAAEWATSRVRSDDRISSYPRRIATRWVVADPEAAMAWLASLPAGADRGDGVAETFRVWAMRDHEAAWAWVERVEPQPWNEPAIAVYARAIAKDQPQHAMEMAHRFSDEELREGTMIVIGQVWTRQDRAAAEAWLSKHDVPERVRKVSAMVREDPAGDRKRAAAEANASAEPAGSDG